MSYFLLAAICTVIGLVPLLLGKRFLTSIASGIFGFLILWGLFYWLKVVFLPPYLGWPVFLTVVYWTINSALNAAIEEESPTGGVTGPQFAVPVFYVVLLVGSWIVGSTFFRAGEFASLIGPVQQQVWTRDSQPKDVRHVRLIGTDTAIYLATKWVGSAGAIGSQYSLARGHLTLQRIKGDLKYVIPLEFAGFGQWTSNGDTGVPAYLIIDAQDPFLEPKMVMLPEGKRLVYTPGAYFGKNLERYLRQHGFNNVGFAQTRFEVDEDGQPWWVVSTYTRTIVWDGEKLHDVALVNPTTGEIRRYALDQVPVWVDRVMPSNYVQDYLTYRGQLSSGWPNSFWSKQGLTKPEASTLIYGVGDRLEWVTGITSDTNHDDSLVGIAYTDSRTGRTTIYRVDGGATDTAIESAVNANAYAKQFKLHAGSPQIYNIYGVMTAVVPLLNDVDGYQGTALVSVRDVQIVGVGQDIENASRQYQEKLYQSGQQALPGNTSKLVTVTGVVDRIRQDVGPTGSPYIIHLAGIPRLFTLSSQDQANVKVPLTQVGDRVTVEYVSSGDSVVPVKRFDNLSLSLDQSPISAEVSASAVAKRGQADVAATAADARRRIETMSDEDVARLVPAQ